MSRRLPGIWAFGVCAFGADRAGGKHWRLLQESKSTLSAPSLCFAPTLCCIPAVVAEGDGKVAEGLAKEAAKPGCDLAWGQLLDLHRLHEKRCAGRGGLGVASQLRASRAWHYHS